jgi:3'-phosphoadenosine 5'-phosphosulfate sulfotransferase (PAPS reductase)/FAD synthetase
MGLLPLRRDEAGVAHVVALSGGKDSTALAVWLQENEPRPYNFVCTPTSDELPEMFEHWRNLGKLLGSPIIPLTNGTLKSVCDDQGALPNFRMRFCTRLLKIAPFKAMLLEAMPAVAYVGLRADEADREGVDYGGDVKFGTADGITQRYPLREIGWGVGDVLKYLGGKGIVIPERTDCARCFFQRLGEWYRLWQRHPDIFDDAIADEDKFGFTYRTPGRDTWATSLRDLKAEFERGRVPEISLRMMDKRKDMCRTCTL